jgi:hypothetical protein
MKRTAIVGTTRMGIANANAKTTTAWTTSMSFRGSVLDRSHITGSLMLRSRRVRSRPIRAVDGDKCGAQFIY